jgi:septal ring factor EnvC (AmiA/AmiB activator)
MDLGHNIATGITLVAGKIVKNFGAATEAGPTTGMTIAASPGAVVLSPCQGRVGFAAPFRSYGKLIILECGHGDDFVLAGLGRLDAAIGQAMSKGEPLGRMGEGSPPVLYLELRRAGTPVDPAPFLALR